MRLTQARKLTYLIFGLFYSSTSVHASDLFEDVRFVTGVSFGNSTVSFKDRLDQTINFPTAGLMVAATKERWQLSLNTAFSFDDAEISEEEEFGEASRKDIDVTLGYQISNNWIVFAGYKTGETDLSFIGRDAEDEGTAVKLPEKYEQDGPYIGASYSWKFEKAGRLSVSLAYANLDAVNHLRGDVDDDEEPDADVVEFDDVAGRAKGDIDGFSYGVTWTMPLSGSLLFQTKFKINDYLQDVTAQGQKFKNVDDKFRTLQIGLAYVY